MLLKMYQFLSGYFGEKAKSLEENQALRGIEKNRGALALKKIVTQSESQSFLDSVVENIPNMIFVKEAETLRFVRFNKAGEELLGYRREELIGKNDSDFFPPEQADYFVSKDRAVLEGGIVVDIPEEPVQTKTGTRFLHTKKIPICDETGKPHYLLGISEDITERKAAEAQRLLLIQEQAGRVEAEKIVERYSFLSEASAALSESLDDDQTLDAFAKVVVHHFADWCSVYILNEDDLGAKKLETAVTIHKDPAKTAMGNKWRKRYPDSLQNSEVITQVVTTGLPLLAKDITPEMVRASCRSEEEFKELFELGVYSAIIVPVEAYGKISGVLSFISSEPEKRFTDVDLSIAQDLSKRVGFAIENSKLFQKAQEANQAKSTFLANMSHEIRTPLGAMLGFADMVSEAGGLNDEQKAHLGTITRNGRQLLRIVDEILDLSKVESEKMELEQISFSLPTLIEDVTGLLKIKAYEKGLAFYMTPLNELPETIVSDPTRLRQVLLNVIGNSIKFTEEGSIFLSTQVLPGKAAGQKSVIEFAVRDTGVGISIDQEKQLFRPFSQADGSITRKFGGTGLGLVLAKKLARMLGGDLVLAKSAPGLGSTFVVTIEVQGTEVVETDHAAAVASQHQISKPALNFSSELTLKKILVVDDAPDNRTLVSWYLDKMGYQVDVAESGSESVEKTMHNDYDLILMDIQMPEMDGFETLKQLREHEIHKPIIAVTAHAMKGDRERCLKGGFDDYLIKPIDRKSLKESVTRHLSKDLH